MAEETKDKKPVTILGGKFELIGVKPTSSLILKGNEVRWDYLTKEQAMDLVSEGCPHIKLVKAAKADEKTQELLQEPPK